MAVRRSTRVLAALAAVVGVLGAYHQGAPQATVLSEPCINGVWPLNPYVVNCNLQPRQGRVLGSAPDAGALIACDGNPQCLSLYVNGGYGWYPGAVLVPGYHP